MITRTCDKCGELISSKPWIAPRTKVLDDFNVNGEIIGSITLALYDGATGEESDADICERCLKDIFGELCRDAEATG